MAARPKMHVKMTGDSEHIDERKYVRLKEEGKFSYLKFEDKDDTNLEMKTDPDSQMQPPETKHRRMFDGVEVPTLAAVRAQQAGALKNEDNKKVALLKKEEDKKLALLKNPKIKQNADMALHPDTLRARLRPIGFDIQDQYFTIDQATREALVTREFMSTTYGGSSQATFPSIAPERVAVHGKPYFMFMIPTDYQPEAPQLPGAPGLRLCAAPGQDLPVVERTFVKMVPTRGPQKSVYQFVGMYEMKAAVPPYLTVAEYRTQTPRFHNKWAEAIKEEGWGLPVLARILLRKELGREPTREEENQTLKHRWAKCRDVITPEEIKVAYFQGKEVMGVWTMKCVGYDNQLQSELRKKFPVWNAMSPAEKKAYRKAIQLDFKTKAKEQKLRHKKPKANKPKTSLLKKRKREETPNIETQVPEDEDDSEAGESDSLEYVDLPAVKSCNFDVIELSDDDEVPSKHRKCNEGTRLSPICLS